MVAPGRGLRGLESRSWLLRAIERVMPALRLQIRCSMAAVSLRYCSAVTPSGSLRQPSMVGISRWPIGILRSGFVGCGIGLRWL